MELPDGFVFKTLYTFHRTSLDVDVDKSELVMCKNCKHFEQDVIDDKFIPGVPVIVAHNMCHFWGNGCATDPDGWCYKGEKEGE